MEDFVKRMLEEFKELEERIMKLSVFFEGNGEYIYKNGNRYVGEFKNNKKTGKGVMHYYTGKKFEGNFENDQWKGQGKFIYEDGKYLTGEFDGFNSKLVEMHYSENSNGFGYFVNGEYIEVSRSTRDDDALEKALLDDLK